MPSAASINNGTMNKNRNTTRASYVSPTHQQAVLRNAIATEETDVELVKSCEPDDDRWVCALGFDVPNEAREAP